LHLLCTNKGRSSAENVNDGKDWKDTNRLSRRGKATSAFGVASVRAPLLFGAAAADLAGTGGVDGFSPFAPPVPSDGPEPLTRLCTLFKNPFIYYCEVSYGVELVLL
jgi:hypothetical protein